MRFKLRRLAARKKWRLDYTLNGVRHQPSFKTKELAKAEQERVQTQVNDCGTAWVALDDNTRTKLMSILREIEASGKTLQDVWDEYKRRSFGKKIIAKKLGEAYEQFMAERRSLRLSKEHLGGFRTTVGRFVKTRAAQFVTQVTRQDIVTFLKPYADLTFNSYRSHLKQFFAWCLHLHYADENPVATVEKIDRRRLASYDRAPGVLHYDDCKALLKAALELDPGMLRYVAVCLLAGLRPKREAVLLSPTDLTDTIHVRGKHAKDRQARYVEMVPALKEWLALPLPAPAQGPRAFDYPIKNWRRRFDAIRARAGLLKLEPRQPGKQRPKIAESRWSHDCMRHTFASAFYALHGPDRTIAAMGHGDYDMLFGHYRRLMTKEEAAQILCITPAVVMKDGCVDATKKEVRLTREKLYEKVWSVPTTQLAKELGISDVALGKRCSNLNVPKPPQGYWAKVAAGQKPEKKPLPPLIEFTSGGQNAPTPSTAPPAVPGVPTMKLNWPPTSPKVDSGRIVHHLDG